MAIEVHEEPRDIPVRLIGLEECCFCHTPTNTWYLPKDVACCASCAETKSHEDVPSKHAWCQQYDARRKSA